MNDEFPALNAHVGALLLVLNLTILLLGGLLVHHASALRRERRGIAGPLRERAVAGKVALDGLAAHLATFIDLDRLLSRAR